SSGDACWKDSGSPVLLVTTPQGEAETKGSPWVKLARRSPPCLFGKGNAAQRCRRL
ncbi:unnamed protein product, partial [marine sediment metagenome]